MHAHDIMCVRIYPLRRCAHMSAVNEARKVFQTHGGTLRTTEALSAGIHPRTLYALRDSGTVEQLARGLYRLAGLPPQNNPDLTTVARRIPQGVVCLISALAFHELTTQIPHAVHLALPRTARHPVLEYPPLRVFRFATDAYSAGIDTPVIDGVAVRIYNPEKTLADCFKFRNKIGMDVVLEALKAYCEKRRKSLQKVLEYARICRVEKVMRPYLEANT